MTPREEAHALYLAVARREHPDKGGNASVFAEAALAWAALRDDGARREYDARLALFTDPCPRCGGLGARARGFGPPRRCEACGGCGRAER